MKVKGNSFKIILSGHGKERLEERFQVKTQKIYII